MSWVLFPLQALQKGIACSYETIKDIFRCVYSGIFNLYVIMIMLVMRKFPCQHFAGLVLANGCLQDSTWVLR
jgi:hypothetical protein